MSETRIQGQNVILVEGWAREFVANTKSAAGMHGFVIMVPPDDNHECFLDLLWRVAAAYDCMPDAFASRTMVRNIVEAMMSRERRELERNDRSAERAQRNRHLPAKADMNPVPAPKSKTARIARRAEPMPVRGGKGKDSARKRS